MREFINIVEAASKDVLYHGSTELFDIRHARPLTHFGTRAAAEHRLTVKSGNSGGYLYPVHLAINNPLRIRDRKEFEHSNFKLVDMLHYTIKAISADERGLLMSRECSADSIVELLSSKGFDGMVYKNAVEDPGKLSWMVFSASQIAPVGEPIKFGDHP